MYTRRLIKLQGITYILITTPQTNDRSQIGVGGTSDVASTVGAVLVPRCPLAPPSVSN